MEWASLGLQSHLDTPGWHQGAAPLPGLKTQNPEAQAQVLGDHMLNVQLGALGVEAVGGWGKWISGKLLPCRAPRTTLERCQWTVGAWGEGQCWDDLSWTSEKQAAREDTWVPPVGSF